MSALNESIDLLLDKYTEMTNQIEYCKSQIYSYQSQKENAENNLQVIICKIIDKYNFNTSEYSIDTKKFIELLNETINHAKSN